MEDINDRLDRLLSDPNIADKLSGILSSLTDGEGKPPFEESKSSFDPLAAFEGFDMSDILNLLSFTGGQGGDASRLLSALGPYLRPSRRKRIEEAKTLLTLWQVLPLLTKKKDEKGETKCKG